MKWTQEAYIKAYRYAGEAHGDQKVPGTNISYLMHISFVTMEIIVALRNESGHDENLAIQCALLHDVIEDTEKTHNDIEIIFGEAVASGVQALSKNPDVQKTDQMLDSLDRIVAQPKEVQLVKLADRITNLAKPPASWSDEKKLDYKEEALQIYNYLGKASKYLGNRISEKIIDYAEY